MENHIRRASACEGRRRNGRQVMSQALTPPALGNQQHSGAKLCHEWGCVQLSRLSALSAIHLGRWGLELSG